MSVLEKQISLFASFKAFVSENPKEKQKNIGCTPFYRKYSKKSQEFEVLLLSNPSNHIIIPAVNYSTEDKIQFVFQKLTTNEFLGSISFTTDLFSSVPQKEFSQWVTLFDDLEDDLFDGNLAEDDEDTPRAYLFFRISKGSQNSEKKPSPEFENNPLPIDDKNVSFANEDEDSEAESSNEDNGEKDDDEDEEIIDDGKYKLEQKIETEDLVKELRQRLQSISTPEDLIKVTQEIDSKRGNYEAEIMKKIFRKRNLMDEDGRIIDDSKKIIELEQEVSIYRLEHEKITTIETNTKEMRQTNVRLEKQYDEILRKYKSCIESNEKECKLVVKENKDLRTEVISLQEQISNLNREIVDLKKKSLEPKYQIELDKLKVEKSKLKSQNLKKLLEDITNQRNNLSQALSQEKEDNSKLKKKLEETSDIYKTNIDHAKDLEDEYEERAKEHAKSLTTISESLTESHKKIFELENLLEDLKQEMILTKNENDKLNNENKNLMETLRNLNNELKVTKMTKFEEVSQLTNKINENQLEFDRLFNQNEHLKRELEFNNIQLKKNQDFDYPNQLKQKENLFHESEKQRNKLQDDLSVAHKQYKQNLEEINKKNIENKEAMNKLFFKEENGCSSKPITVSTLREIEERFRQEILEKDKKINDLIYIVKTYKISEQMLAEHDKIIEELRKQIAELKETINKLLEERDKLNQEIFRLTEELIKQSKTNLDQLNTINHICEDNKRLQQNLDSAIECIPAPKQQHSDSKYVAAKGDKIDRKMSVFVNKAKSLPIQFIRIGEGLYTFGTKKIAVKILNGKIVIRVGGGYLMIEEFLRLYTFSELKKLGEIAKTGKNAIPIPESRKVKSKAKEEDSISDSDSSDSEVENIKSQTVISQDDTRQEPTPIKSSNMLSPKNINNAVTSIEKKKGGKKLTNKKGSTKVAQKRFTLFKKEDEEAAGKKKGNDVTLEVMKGGSAIKYEKQNSTGPNFHSPKNFQSPPPSKKALGKNLK